MDVNWESWKFWLDTLQTAAVGLTWLWMLIDKGRSRNSESIQQMEEIVDVLDRRVLSLENKTATHEDVAKLRAEIEGMKSTLSQVDQVTNRIYSYLLNNKGE